MINIIKTNKRCYLNKKDFIDIEDILRDLKADYESFNLPETFEELKKLCRGFEGVKIFPLWIEVRRQNQTRLIFTDTGKIAEPITLTTIAYDRTPTQMYQIIKNLTEGL